MPPPGGYTGRFATVLIEDAVIGPGKFDRTPWDPGLAGEISPDVISDLVTALAGSNPYSAVIGILAAPALNSAVSAVQKPDVYGTIRLDGFGMIGIEYWLSDRDSRTENSFTPAFPGPSGYVRVPVDADVRLRVHLWDADLLDQDDEVGIAVINGGDMRAALLAQEKFEVEVSDQTANQILFIGIDVFLE